MKSVDRDVELQIYGIECVAQMAYWSAINVEYCRTAARKLPAGGLKDTLIHYQQSEQNWLNKIMKALKGYSTNGVDIHSSLAKDLEETPMIAMFDIISKLKKARDIEGIADVVDELSDVHDVSKIFTNLKAIIRNQKNTENAASR